MAKDLKVWKFPLPIQDRFTLDLPRGAQLLRFALQGEQPAVWALVDPAMPIEPRHFRMAGTGHVIRDDVPFARTRFVYVGTALMYNGMLVWHLFEEVDADA